MTTSQPHHITSDSVYNSLIYMHFVIVIFKVMHKMMYKKEELYLTTRNSVFYFVRRVPRDLIQYYSSNRISFSLKTKSKLKALRVSSTVKQKLEDYWLGLRLQKLDIPQILIAKDKIYTERDHNPTLTQALE